jgi:HK97 family phage portal protein
MKLPTPAGILRGVASAFGLRRERRADVSLLDLARGATNATGVPVTEANYLTLVAAYACVNVVATDLAYFPTRVYRKRPGGGREEANDVAASELLRVTPDGGESTPMRFRQALYGYRVGRGNGYAEVQRLGNGDPAGLFILDPATLPKRRQRDGRLYYEQPTGGTIPYPNVIHLAGLGPDGVSGWSPVRLFRQALALGLATETVGASLFGNGSIPRGYIKFPTELSATAADSLRSSFERIHGGPYSANRVAILEEGAEFVPTSIPPEDAQFLATRQFQVLEVCRIYRVPPNKVMDYSQSHLSNVEAANIDYVTTTLAPTAEETEQVYNLRLLSERERRAGYYIEHDLTAILRGDMKARAEFYGKALVDGWMTRDEVRQRENLDPIGAAGGGDKFTVAVNLTTLDKVGAAAPAPVAPAVRVPVEAEPDEEPDEAAEPSTGGNDGD